MSPDSGFLVMWPGGADRHSGIEVTFTRITVRLDQIDEIADAEIARRGGAPARDRFEDGTPKKPDPAASCGRTPTPAAGSGPTSSGDQAPDRARNLPSARDPAAGEPILTSIAPWPT